MRYLIILLILSGCAIKQPATKARPERRVNPVSMELTWRLIEQVKIHNPGKYEYKPMELP